MQDNKDKTQFDLNVDTQVIIGILKQTKVGDLIPYAVMSEAIKRDVMHRARYVMDSARRVLLREEGMVFGPVTGQGLRNMSDVEKVGSAPRYIESMRRKATKGIKVVTAVKFDELPAHTKTEHNVALSIFGALKQATTAGSQKKIEAAVVENNGALLASKQAMQAFMQ